MVRRFTANGSAGNIREIYPVGGFEGTYEARLDGVSLGYYFSEDCAYKAIQEALAAHIESTQPTSLIERQRRGL